MQYARVIVSTEETAMRNVARRSFRQAFRSGTFTILSFVALAVFTAPLPAQDPGSKPQDERSQNVNTKRVTLNMENADIRYALKLLFQSVGVNYTLDQAVQGSVTVSLTDVPFRTALESILRTTASQVPLTYRVEGDVYNISLKAIDQPTTPETGGEDPEPVAEKKRTIKLQVNFADAIDIADALGGGTITTRFGGFGGGGFGMGGMGGGMGGSMGGGMGGMMGGGFGGGMGGFGGGMGGFGGGGFGGGGFGGGGFGGGGFGGGGFGGGGGGGLGGGGFRR